MSPGPANGLESLTSGFLATDKQPDTNNCQKSLSHIQQRDNKCWKKWLSLPSHRKWLWASNVPEETEAFSNYRLGNNLYAVSERLINISAELFMLHCKHSRKMITLCWVYKELSYSIPSSVIGNQKQLDVFAVMLHASVTTVRKKDFFLVSCKG